MEEPVIKISEYETSLGEIIVYGHNIQYFWTIFSTFVILYQVVLLYNSSPNYHPNIIAKLSLSLKSTKLCWVNAAAHRYTAAAPRQAAEAHGYAAAAHR